MYVSVDLDGEGGEWSEGRISISAVWKRTPFRSFIVVVPMEGFKFGGY